MNDGVCDCCDGSDEWSGRVECPDTCLEVGRSAREELQTLAKAFKKVRLCGRETLAAAPPDAPARRRASPRAATW